ncbi:MAG: hypothetical protein A2017_00345 [Lentisphaerae bacterium GWF2_44_16]|nr:MAG: hypothetical protein A2017_00345 [Lentisphaerae bacterium GWF2_44_16]
MKDKFIDTNLWVYLYSSDSKALKVRELFHDIFPEIIISSQVLGELYNVIIKKNIKPAKDARVIVSDIAKYHTVVSIASRDVLKAVHLSEKYSFSYWDSLIIASAINNNCNILYSEDMQHRQKIENVLTIVNPFK